jgi:hypothetical protein
MRTDSRGGRLRAGARAGLVVAAGAVAASPGVAGATTQTFTSNGTFTVPPLVTSLTVDVEGAEGGAANGSDFSPGGKGGQATGTVAVTAGEALSVIVGGVGASVGESDPGGMGGGNGGTAGAGGGGGRSELDLGTTYSVSSGMAGWRRLAPRGTLVAGGAAQFASVARVGAGSGGPRAHLAGLVAAFGGSVLGSGSLSLDAAWPVRQSDSEAPRA